MNLKKHTEETKRKISISEKGKFGKKRKDFLLGKDVECLSHGLHKNWYFNEKHNQLSCRFCLIERTKKYQKNNKEATITIAAKRHARIKGRDFSITKLDIEELLKIQRNKCNISGITFEESGNNSYSLDRIDSNKGYTRENIQLVTKAINIMKSNFDQQFFIDTCIAISVMFGTKKKK